MTDPAPASAPGTSAAAPLSQQLLPLTAQYQARVWGGQQLRASAEGETPTGEAWIAWEDSRVESGPCAGQTLGALMAASPQALLGRALAGRYARFPLLIKLLDCADWLSVQVHPDDEQAGRMVGEGMFGKTEAWHFLEARPGAEILAGVRAGTGAGALERAIRGGTVLEVAERLQVEAGDTVFIPANTLHALGPGLLLYEVQQSSDTTYRVYDWDRPASAGRALHTEESVAVTDPALGGDLRRAGEHRGVTRTVLTQCRYFVLERLALAAGETLLISTAGAQGGTDSAEGSFQLLSCVEGRATVVCGDELQPLERFQTLLVAGGTGAYQLASSAGAVVLMSRVPAQSSGQQAGQQAGVQ